LVTRRGIGGPFARFQRPPKRDPFQPPDGWPGSGPEWLVFRELERTGLKEGVDFLYQSVRFGGRQQKGGAIFDFEIYNPPDLCINVQSEFFHYSTVDQRSHDALRRAQVESQGVTLIFIDEADLRKNARFFVRAALRFQDYSRMTGR